MKREWKSVGAVVTDDEKKIIEDRAKNNKMTVNEYIRNRLLYDPEQQINHQLTVYEQDLITMVKKCYNLLQLNLESEEVTMAIVEAEKSMVKKGYLNLERASRLKNL